MERRSGINVHRIEQRRLADTRAPADIKAKVHGAPAARPRSQAWRRGAGSPASARGAVVSGGAGAATSALGTPAASQSPAVTSRWDHGEPPRGHLATP